MIRPAGFAGAAFGTREAGDLRADAQRRAEVSAALGISPDWAFARQIHSAIVIEATATGVLGDGDSIITTYPEIPVAVATADCVPVIIEAADAAAVVHAGWRGAAAGVVPVTLARLRELGHEPRRAAIGPAIGPCCYEVGADVASLFGDYVDKTGWGTTSVDIPGYLEAQLGDLEVWRSTKCTYTSPQLHSWRRDQTKERQVAVAWLPSD